MEDKKPLPIQEGAMCTFMSLVHNARYFVVVGDAAIKICWGDFCRDHIGWPVIVKPRFEDPIEINDLLLITYENFADYDVRKQHEIQNYDFTAFKQQYGVDAPDDRLQEDLEVYEKDFILDKTVFKFEQGVLLRRNPFPREGEPEYEEYQLPEDESFVAGAEG